MEHLTFNESLSLHFCLQPHRGFHVDITMDCCLRHWDVISIVHSWRAVRHTVHWPRCFEPRRISFFLSEADRTKISVIVNHLECDVGKCRVSQRKQHVTLRLPHTLQKENHKKISAYAQGNIQGDSSDEEMAKVFTSLEMRTCSFQKPREVQHTILFPFALAE